LIREKWHLIVSFLKSRISLVDPDRLKSITVMLPQNSRSGVRTKKVKLLITLFLLLVSENYILLQKTNGYTAIEKDGYYSTIYNIKASLSKFYKKTKPSKRSIYRLTKTYEKKYEFEALEDLKPYEIHFGFNSRPQLGAIENVPSTPQIRRSPSNSSINDLSPILKSRSPKKRQTRIGMNQLIKMFQIEDEPQNSQSNEDLSKVASIEILEDIKPLEDSGIERKRKFSGGRRLSINMSENDINQKTVEQDVGNNNLSPIKEVDKSNLSSANEALQSPNEDQNIESGTSNRLILPDISSFNRSGMRRATKMKVKLLLRQTKHLMFDNTLEVITKTGFRLQKVEQENPKYNSVTLCKVVTRLLLAIVKFERFYVFVDFHIDYKTIPESWTNPVNPDIFKHVGLFLRVWTNSALILSKPLDIPLSESGFEFFSRLGMGERAERAIKKIIGDNRANESDKIALSQLISKLIGKF
jgi:hypothetical protein